MVPTHVLLTSPPMQLLLSQSRPLTNLHINGCDAVGRGAACNALSNGVDQAAPGRAEPHDGGAHLTLSVDELWACTGRELTDRVMQQ